ncbi:MAG TPA: hypothetical protein VFZ49_09775 [Pyrinomonadaceae bacterium]
MKKLFAVTFLLSGLVSIASAQQASKAAVQAGLKKFPGVSATQMEQLIAAKRVMTLALPTWLPTGFKVENIKSRLGRAVALEDREFFVIYSRTLPNGKTQRFALEAGFEGLGGLPYDNPKSLRSAVGQIDLYYEPKDLDDDGKVLKNYVYTEWFKVGNRTDWHYIGMYGAPEEGDPGIAMISLADTERILRSLQRL